MASRTQVLESVKSLRWRDVEASLAAEPTLTAYRDDRGRNFLHVCCGVNVKEKKLSPVDSIRTADVLLSAGIDINQEAFTEHHWKATPLWYAISRGQNRRLATHLLQRGCDPNHCLWAAAFKDDVATIAVLLDHGADIDPVAEDETPFLSAVKSSHFRAAEALLARGANVNFQDSRGMTALHYMLKKDSDKRHFRTVLHHGARGDLKNGTGETAAEIMARKRDPDFKAMASGLSTRRGTSTAACEEGMNMARQDATKTLSPQQLEQLWAEHLKGEFETKDVEATLATMVDDAYVNHMPVNTGGRGKEALRAFYRDDFIPSWPDDLEMTPVNRVVGDGQLVDELHLTFTHSKPMPWFLPNVPPTRKKISVDVVVVVQFRGDKLACERIYWDHAAVLRQADLLKS